MFLACQEGVTNVSWSGLKCATETDALGSVVKCSDYEICNWLQVGSTPHPATSPVTTRIITFLVGNPYEPLLVMVVTGWGVDPGSKLLVVLFLQMYFVGLMAPAACQTIN